MVLVVLAVKVAGRSLTVKVNCLDVVIEPSETVTVIVEDPVAFLIGVTTKVLESSVPDKARPELLLRTRLVLLDVADTINLSKEVSMSPTVKLKLPESVTPSLIDTFDMALILGASFTGFTVTTKVSDEEA